MDRRAFLKGILAATATAAVGVPVMETAAAPLIQNWQPWGEHPLLFRVVVSQVKDGVELKWLDEDGEHLVKEIEFVPGVVIHD